MRAEIVPTGSKWVKSARIEIDAPAERIFEFVARPDLHSHFDGSGTVSGRPSGAQRLGPGAKFGMGMRIGLPYRTANTVVEFEEGRRIAWCHLGGHRWRYELEPIDDRRTLVTETFDGSTAKFPPLLLAMNALENNQKAVARTLVRLKELAESGFDPQAGR